MGRLEINKHNEVEIDRRIEADLAGHRQPPNGRNLLAFRMSTLDNPSYRKGFELAFPDAPGEQKWFDSRFCPRCDRLFVQCVCDMGQPIIMEQRFMAPRGARVK